MRPNLTYKETQNSLKKWWWLVVVIVVLTSGYCITAMPDIITTIWPWLALGAIALSAMFLLFTMWLIIDKNGIHVRYFPFIIKWKTFDWAEIESIKLEKYKPLREFGGWGVRIGLQNKVAYSVYGKQALIISLKKNKKKVYIGTQNEQKLLQFLKEQKRV